MIDRDGHIRVLPLHVANKIAAGEVVERPASVVKELVENAIDAGSRRIAVSIVQGGRKLVAVQDDGCGMTKDDAVLSLERQATSKILDVNDIEKIDTLGFRGEAIPSIASVSRFTLTTRREDSDEGTFIQVNAGTLAEVRAAGCPPGTLVEVRDLFCNVPARRKFLRSYATEEGHVKTVFTVNALAHPKIGFTLSVDGRELYRLAAADSLEDRVRDLFGEPFVESMLPVKLPTDAAIRVSGFIERPNLSTPTRRDQYIFVNGRPATAPSIAYAIRESYPRRQGDLRPALILFIDLPPEQVDVNVHPTKKEVRFRDNAAVRQTLMAAIERTLGGTVDEFPACAAVEIRPANPVGERIRPPHAPVAHAQTIRQQATTGEGLETPSPSPGDSFACQTARPPFLSDSFSPRSVPTAAPVAIDLPLADNEMRTRPWAWFKFLATTDSGYLLIETDSGVVTINPHAARERIAFERLISSARKSNGASGVSQPLLIPETVRLSPPDFARIAAALPVIEAMGFRLEEFGTGTFKVEAIPQLVEGLSPETILPTISHDLAEGKRSGERWREELIAKSIARSFAGMSLSLTEASAVRLVEELAACRMPYVCPRGKPIMIFTSTRELNRKFSRE